MSGRECQSAYVLPIEFARGEDSEDVRAVLVDSRLFVGFHRGTGTDQWKLRDTA